MSPVQTTPGTVVLKYGGSSVADADKVRGVASIVARRCKAGEKLVVVVSAMGKTTNHLIELAGSISPQSGHYKREMDMLLATGEQVSASLLAMALKDLGVDALSMNAFQIGMLTTAAHSSARIRDIQSDRLRTELDARGVVVVTGFQGVTDEGDLTAAATPRPLLWRPHSAVRARSTATWPASTPATPGSCPAPKSWNTSLMKRCSNWLRPVRKCFIPAAWRSPINRKSSCTAAQLFPMKEGQRS